MKPHTQLAQVLAEIDRRGALMDGVAATVDRCAVDLEYPRIFSDLTREHSFVAFVVGGVRVHSNLRDEEHNLEELLGDKVITPELSKSGFFPFGRPATGSYDRVCFDMRAKRRSFDAPVVVMDHEAILSHNQIPKPRKLADGLADLFALEFRKAEPGAAPNGGPACPPGNSEPLGRPPSES